jgi:ubiquitin-conjugating enzyme E2 Z|tara:strand:- start:3130 stop:3816 length:687 start_codon:yes stop_codon:yes gene_type:complete
MKPCFKRIVIDIKDIINSPIENIYYFPDEDNILNGCALIIGPNDTPYSYGNYIFEFNFSEEYPFKPPKVTFKSNDGKTRFNPNLYRNGKVCLSILNTWSGDQWSACQTIRSVLLTLQTTMNDMPLLNEPGVTTANINSILQYNKIIEYKNYEFTILHYISNIENIPVQNPELILAIQENFMKSKQKILEQISRLKDEESDATIGLRIYDMRVVLNYSDLYTRACKIIN